MRNNNYLKRQSMIPRIYEYMTKLILKTPVCIFIHIYKEKKYTTKVDISRNEKNL